LSEKWEVIKGERSAVLVVTEWYGINYALTLRGRPESYGDDWFPAFANLYPAGRAKEQHVFAY
jgi:hypothetical protein